MKRRRRKFVNAADEIRVRPETRHNKYENFNSLPIYTLTHNFRKKTKKTKKNYFFPFARIEFFFLLNKFHLDLPAKINIPKKAERKEKENRCAAHEGKQENCRTFSFLCEKVSERFHSVRP